MLFWEPYALLAIIAIIDGPAIYHWLTNRKD